MGYTAPDPAQFAGMTQAYGYMAPTAAVQITLPTYILSGPCIQISRIIYMNQCNPGAIMEAAANWLKLAEKYLAAHDRLKELTGSLTAEDWSGKDRDAFDGKVDKILGQLQIIAAFAMIVGISLFAIAAMLAVMVPLMLAVSSSMLAWAIIYMTVQKILPWGPAMAEAPIRVNATITATSCLGVMETLDNAIGAAGKALAGVMAGGMTGTWIGMAAKGEIINPADTIGSTGFSIMQGLSQLALRNLMAPGHTGGGIGKFSPKLDGLLGKAHPFLTGFAGAQGVHNIGMNINSDVNDGAGDLRGDWGVDPMGLDWIPNNHGFEDEARSGEQPPDLYADGEPELPSREEN